MSSSANLSIKSLIVFSSMFNSFVCFLFSYRAANSFQFLVVNYLHLLADPCICSCSIHQVPCFLQQGSRPNRHPTESLKRAFGLSFSSLLFCFFLFVSRRFCSLIRLFS